MDGAGLAKGKRFVLGWLKTVLGRGGSLQPGLYLAAFGKHPGWNDHIDDQGLDSTRLVEVKRRLYIEGVGGNIDAGTWAKDSAQPEPSIFKHVIVWLDGPSVVMVRMWSSVDGKGRTAFPMVLCVEAVGIDVQWALSTCLPVLERVEAKCKAATTSQEVIRVLDDSRVELRQVSSGVQPLRVLDASDRDAAMRTLSSRIDQEFGRTELHRLLHRLVGMLGEPTGSTSSLSAPAMKTQHVRVPRAANQPPEAAWAWLRLLSGWGGRPALVIMPLRQKFIDLVVGTPGRGDFACLRAGEEMLPVVTQIPYTIDSTTAARYDAMVASLPAVNARSA